MRLFDRARFLALVLVPVLCLLLAGCGKSKITKDNFDKIQNGMTQEDVEAILGKGEKETGDGANIAAQGGVYIEPSGGNKNLTTYAWEKGNKKITIMFKDGKVAHKKAEGW